MERIQLDENGQDRLKGDVPELQRAVQRKLGRCLLQLQRYEKALKALLSYIELAGPVAGLESVRDQKIAAVEKRTMGALVGMLTENYMTHRSPDDESLSSQACDDTHATFSYRHQMTMTVEQYESRKSALIELVDLRNFLVHHFTERFYLWSVGGCTAANKFLDESYESITRHYEELCAWAQSMHQAALMMTSFIESEAFEDVLKQIPVVPLDDPSGLELSKCLYEAEVEFAQNGWTRLETAIDWINRNHRRETPKRYGFRSWKHYLHESKAFETRKERLDDKPSIIFYRSKHA